MFTRTVEGDNPFKKGFQKMTLTTRLKSTMIGTVS